jgi:hypothetical protein
VSQEELSFRIEHLLSVQGFPYTGGSASFRSEPRPKGSPQGLDPLLPEADEAFWEIQSLQA